MLPQNSPCKTKRPKPPPRAFPSVQHPPSSQPPSPAHSARGSSCSDRTCGAEWPNGKQGTRGPILGKIAPQAHTGAQRAANAWEKKLSPVETLQVDSHDLVLHHVPPKAPPIAPDHPRLERGEKRRVFMSSSCHTAHRVGMVLARIPPSSGAWGFMPRAISRSLPH